MTGEVRPVDSLDYSQATKPNPLVPKLVLTLVNEEGLEDREEFLAYAEANQWAIMQNAQAARKGNEADKIAALYALATSSVLPEDRDRFELWMLDHGRDDMIYDKLYDALGALWAGETRLPLVPISSEPSGSTGESAPTGTGSSSEPVSVPPESDTAGQEGMGEFPILPGSSTPG